MLRQLQQMDIDVVADLHNVLRSWVIDLYYTLRGKRVCILQKQRKERHRILKRHQETATPFTQRYFDVFQHLGLATTPQFTSLFPIPPAIPQGWEKTSEERWIGIAPFARYRNKTYPLERMREVVEQLAALPHTHVFLFGAKGQEAAQLQQWTAIGQQVTSLAGQLPLAEELALMPGLARRHPCGVHLGQYDTSLRILRMAAAYGRCALQTPGVSALYDRRQRKL